MKVFEDKDLMNDLSRLFNVDLEEYPLFYNTYNSLKFDLHKDGFDIITINNLNKKIFDFTFANDENLGILLKFWSNKVNKDYLTKNFKRMVQDLHLNTLVTDFRYFISTPRDGAVSKYLIYIYFELSKNNELLETLRKISIMWEFPKYKGELGVEGSYDHGAYYLSKKNKLLVNIYDDRGMDIISDNKERLTPIYHTFKEYLLKYDFESMKDFFEP